VTGLLPLTIASLQGGILRIPGSTNCVVEAVREGIPCLIGSHRDYLFDIWFSTDWSASELDHLFRRNLVDLSLKFDPLFKLLLILGRHP